MYPAKGLKILLISVALLVGSLAALWTWDAGRTPAHALLPMEPSPALEPAHSAIAPGSPATQLTTDIPAVTRRPASAAPLSAESMSE